jgi:hypothetical protein
MFTVQYLLKLVYEYVDLIDLLTMKVSPLPLVRQTLWQVVSIVSFSSYCRSKFETDRRQ